ncbi:unnamed protein product [Ambrosiozyma monospora]|uniref:Unnamed protein product n=1 Tax=Ambrosiozyma monospora TaxID=43982 RepID=A0A9W6YQN3_AMBMO|nr:unnamed protein product [Ambrosiozyma monospora]
MPGEVEHYFREIVTTYRSDVMYVYGLIRLIRTSYGKDDGFCAGVGIHYGEDNFRNRQVYLDEYYSVSSEFVNLKALQIALNCVLEVWDDENLGADIRRRRVEIRSSSKYAVNCLTRWWQTWQENDWITKKGNIVANKELIQDCLKLIELINDNYDELRYDHIEIKWVARTEYEGIICAEDLAFDATEDGKGDSIYYY